MKRSILTILAVSIVNLCLAQTAFKKNDIYLEAGGNGLFGSVNYERQLTGKAGLGFRIGVGFYSENAFYLTIPVGINYLFPLKNQQSFIDAGLGFSWSEINGDLFGNTNRSPGEDFANFVPGIGYRRHTAKNVMWRVSITPIINKYMFMPWLGVSVGKRF